MQTPCYRQAPETVFEDWQQTAHWSRLAWEAALRAADAKPARKAPARAGMATAGRPAARKSRR